MKLTNRNNAGNRFTRTVGETLVIKPLRKVLVGVALLSVATACGDQEKLSLEQSPAPKDAVTADGSTADGSNRTGRRPSDVSASETKTEDAVTLSNDVSQSSQEVVPGVDGVEKVCTKTGKAVSCDEPSDVLLKFSAKKEEQVMNFDGFSVELLSLDSDSSGKKSATIKVVDGECKEAKYTLAEGEKKTITVSVNGETVTFTLSATEVSRSQTKGFDVLISVVKADCIDKCRPAGCTGQQYSKVTVPVKKSQGLKTDSTYIDVVLIFEDSTVMITSSDLKGGNKKTKVYKTGDCVDVFGCESITVKDVSAKDQTVTFLLK